MNLDTKRWYFLAACVVINVCIGFGYAWSVFQKPLMLHFQWEAAAVSLGFSIIMGVSALPQALAGKAQDYFPPRQIVLAGGFVFGIGVVCLGFVQSLLQLYISGILVGLGIGIVYPGTVANMVRFFPERRGLVAGLLAAGMGSGAIVIAPLATVLIEGIGVLGTLKILGASFLVIISGLSRLIQTAPEGYKPAGMSEQHKVTAHSEREKDWREMLGDPLFFLIAGVFIFGPSAGIMIMGHASPIAQQLLGLSPREASIIVGFIALANTIGRIFWGGISDKFGRYSVLIAMFVVLGSALLTLPQVHSYIGVIATLMVVGMCYGGFMGMMASVTADAFGTRHLGVNFGIMFLTLGIASIIGPRLAAIIAQNNQGNYTEAFIIAASFSIVGILFTIGILLKNRKSVKLLTEKNS